jgi:D-alanyl-D-alanine-carboxypeptidase/D-alanyl-D-alanine-endopeptidase
MRLALLTVVLLPALASAKPCEPVKSPDLASAMDVVRLTCALETVGLCLGAIDEHIEGTFGQDRLIQCYGIRRHHNAPTADTLFPIGSVSKIFATTLFAKRVVQGKIDLFAPIGDFVDFQASGDPATDLRRKLALRTIQLIDLADHHSGLPLLHPGAGGDDVTSVTNSFLDCIGDASCWDTYGDFRYSDMAITVLTNAVVENDGVSPWFHDLRQAVLAPLHLGATGTMEHMRQTQPLLWRDRACSFAANGITEDCYNFPTQPASPAGGLWSTGNDMLEWLAYNMGLPVSGETGALELARNLAQSVAANGRCNGFPTCDDPSLQNLPGSHDFVGLAWNIDHDKEAGGGARISKDGDLTRFHAYIAFSEYGKRGVFVLLNSDSGPSRSDIGDMLLHSIP